MRLFLAEIDFRSVADGKEESGRFMVLVEARDPKSCMNEIDKTIRRARAKEGLFPGNVKFRTYDVLDVEKVPQPGLISFYECWPGTERGFGAVGDVMPTKGGDGVSTFFVPHDAHPDEPTNEPVFTLD